MARVELGIYIGIWDCSNLGGGAENFVPESQKVVRISLQFRWIKQTTKALYALEARKSFCTFLGHSFKNSKSPQKIQEIFSLFIFAGISDILCPNFCRFLPEFSSSEIFGWQFPPAPYFVCLWVSNNTIKYIFRAVCPLPLPCMPMGI